MEFFFLYNFHPHAIIIDFYSLASLKEGYEKILLHKDGAPLEHFIPRPLKAASPGLAMSGRESMLSNTCRDLSRVQVASTKHRGRARCDVIGVSLAQSRSWQGGNKQQATSALRTCLLPRCLEEHEWIYNCTEKNLIPKSTQT